MINNKTLNDILGPDTLPIMVTHNGEIFENVITEYVPDSGSYGNNYEEMITEGIDGWKAISGLSNQQDYTGIILHESKNISDNMATNIRNTPGLYAIEEIYNEENDSLGWILLHKKLSR